MEQEAINMLEVKLHSIVSVFSKIFSNKKAILVSPKTFVTDTISKVYHLVPISLEETFTKWVSSAITIDQIMQQVQTSKTPWADYHLADFLYIEWMLHTDELLKAIYDIEDATTFSIEIESLQQQMKQTMLYIWEVCDPSRRDPEKEFAEAISEIKYKELEGECDTIIEQLDQALALFEDHDD